MLTLLPSVIANAADALTDFSSPCLFAPQLRHFLLAVRGYCILRLLQHGRSSWAALVTAMRLQAWGGQESQNRTGRQQRKRSEQLRSRDWKVSIDWLHHIPGLLKGQKELPNRKQQLN